MTVLNLCGFESGNANEASSTGGTFSIQSTTKRSGGYALQVNPTTTGTGFYAFSGFLAGGAQAGNFNVAIMYYRFYFNYATKPAANNEIIARALDTGGATKVTVRIDSSGNLSVWDRSPTALGTGSTVLSAGTFYRIELKVGTETADVNNDGVWELKINGTSEISGSGNTSTVNNATIQLGKAANANSNTIDFFYDDFVADDAAYPGAGQIFRMDPDGGGAYTAWTGTYADIDEVPHDTDTTYITSSTTGEAETASLESGATAGLVGTPLSVKAMAIVRDEGGASAIQVRLRSNTTDTDTTNADPGATYVTRGRIFNTDPATSAAWVASALDALEVGVENNANVAVRCTAAYVMVSENGVATGVTVTPNGMMTTRTTFWGD